MLYYVIPIKKSIDQASLSDRREQHHHMVFLFELELFCTALSWFHSSKSWCIF